MSEKAKPYSGDGKLMNNYGWVQNTSNLSTVRDTVDMMPSRSVNHNEVMRLIYESRCAAGNIKKKWTWDARCRIKAMCATGMTIIDRKCNGYRLTELGEELKKSQKSNSVYRGFRNLSSDEINLFRRGLLTNPPVVRVLSLLNESKVNGIGPLSKYDIGSSLGFAGDIGFTHYEAEYVVRSGKSFNDCEGDSDKWARTILSWLIQVGWVNKDEEREILGKTLAYYTTTNDVDKVLKYTINSTVKYVPQEMLCSHHHPFVDVVQKRRVTILRLLCNSQYVTIPEILEYMNKKKIVADEETLSFDILNLQQAGIRIRKEKPYYKLVDKIVLDEIAERSVSQPKSVEGIEKEIEHYVAKYSETLPAKLVDNLIRYGHDGTNSAALFEMSVYKFFKNMGYESQYLGQGHGRVADVIAKYKASSFYKSYGIIIDAKAYEKYSFPAGDIRKMKEYIKLHGTELMMDMIPNHAFAFVSLAFSNPNEKLNEISTDTHVRGTAIDIFSLLELGSRVAKHELAISDLYDSFLSNTIYIVN